MRQGIGKLDQYRIKTGALASDKSDGRNGAFSLVGPAGKTLGIIASDGSHWEEFGCRGQPWEHVSVSTIDRCPTWEEMSFVKALFWEDSELVLQFHMPRGKHINYHPYCLHLWKPIGLEVPLPDPATVAPVEYAGTT